MSKAPGKSTAGPAPRLTHQWSSKRGKDVKVGDSVTLGDGAAMRCVGRWTKRKGGELIPMVTGVVASGEGKGARRNSPAAEVTHAAKK